MLCLAAALAGCGADDVAIEDAASEGRGMRATSEGAVATQDGTPYRGVGVNYFDAFSRTLRDEGDVSYDPGLSTLADVGIPFARVMAGGYWPVEQRLYTDDPEEFFRRFDRFVRSAEEHRLGLFLTLFWNIATVPDLVGEPVSAWGEPDSRTRRHMRRYVHDVVVRYRGSPSVWGWEVGNEWSLSASLPNASEHRPEIDTALGTPSSRSAADDVTVETVRQALAAVVVEMRRYDRTRIISTGNALPRESAWHNWQKGTWDVDTVEQTAAMLDGDNPTDIVSVHAYGADIHRIALAAQISRDLGKPFFLGEVGVGGPSRRGAGSLSEVLEVITDADVDLAAVWVFDFAAQPEWNITATNDRSWQLQAVAAAND